MIKNVCFREKDKTIEKIMRPKNNNKSNTIGRYLKFYCFSLMIVQVILNNI